MGILTSRLSVTRFRVVGDLPEEGLSDFLKLRLQEYAFRQPPAEIGKELVEGWAEIGNLLNTGFDDLNTWLHTDIAVFSLRVDQKRLPATLFKATLAKRCEAWADENGVTRCPGSVRFDLKDALQSEWLRRQLPSVKIVELAWRISNRQLLVHTRAGGSLERVRKRFHQTFGLKLVLISPLDAIGDKALVDELISTAPTMFTRRGAA